MFVHGAIWCLVSFAYYGLSLLFFSILSKMPQLLQSTDVDLRIAAGEGIALLYELGRDRNEVRRQTCRPIEWESHVVAWKYR